MPKRINEAVPANMKVGINFDANRYLLRDFDMNDLHEAWKDLPANTLVMDNRTVEEYASMVSSRADDMDDVHPDDYALLLESYQQHQRSGNDYNVTYRIYRSDGELRWPRWLARTQPRRVQTQRSPWPSRVRPSACAHRSRDGVLPLRWPEPAPP